MPIELALWRMDASLQRLQESPLNLESSLEEALVQDLSIIQPNLMLLGRQIQTPFGGRVDILAMDGDGDLVVIELKRDKTPRDLVAQLLDYGSWANDLSYGEVIELYERHQEGQLDRAFAKQFGTNPPEEIAERHRLVVVCSQLDPNTERIIGYLNDIYGVPINAVFFRHFEDNDRRYLARSWLIDPSEAEAKTHRRKQPPWNGRDFYVSFGDGDRRNWDDASRYGFIAGGGGTWYSQTLKNLLPGHRVFVHIPQTGYVGVGEVTAEAVPVGRFVTAVDGESRPLLELPLRASRMAEGKDDPDLAEWVVAVRWLARRSREEAFWEKDLFASQHTACKLRQPFTIERLTEHFDLDPES